MPISNVQFKGNDGHGNKYKKHAHGDPPAEKVIVEFTDTAVGQSYDVAVSSIKYTWEPPSFDRPRVQALGNHRFRISVSTNPVHRGVGSGTVSDPDTMTVTVSNDVTPTDKGSDDPPIEVVDMIILEEFLRSYNQVVVEIAKDPKTE